MNPKLAVAALVVALIAAVLAVAALVEAEKAAKKAEGMTSVYGLSFVDLPHAPLRAAERAELAVTGPPFTFRPQQVPGASFARLA